jgi:hypothetical protein
MQPPHGGHRKALLHGDLTLYGKELLRRGAVALEVMGRNPTLTGDLALSYVVWPDGPPRMADVEAAVRRAA